MGPLDLRARNEDPSTFLPCYMLEPADTKEVGPLSECSVLWMARYCMKHVGYVVAPPRTSIEDFLRRWEAHTVPAGGPGAQS